MQNTAVLPPPSILLSGNMRCLFAKHFLIISRLYGALYQRDEIKIHI